VAATPRVEPIGGSPVVPTRGPLRPLGLDEVHLVGGFWGTRQQINCDATIDHHRSWLDKLGWTGHFSKTAGPAGSRRGREFTDSEVYKLMEAMAWDAARSGAQGRDADLVELIGLVGAAQSPDGYLNTAFGGPGQRPRYSDFAQGHELYCAGHLLQAAVAHGRTNVESELLAIGRRVADHVCDTFGPAGRSGICGHPEIEAGLVELFRVTGEQRYLDQARLFVDRRGYRTLPEQEFGWTYFQDDMPVREATVLRGHAVRALYLSAGAVDVAVETGDTELLEAVAAQYDRALARRTYLTGGMGSRHADEAFGEDFVLPAEHAYSETCAGVASIMLAWRLLLATGQARYADVIERTLYNVVATSIGDDGRSFFYANTVHQRERGEPVPADRERLHFAGGVRAPWFEVSCCLGNMARLFASLSAYMATVDSDGLRLHQYANAVVRTQLGDGRRLGLRVRTDYPETGTVSVRVTEPPPGGPVALALRVPAWASGARLDGEVVEPGVAVVRREFAAGDEVRLELPVRPRWTFPDPRIDAVRGCVAVERGPLVLCAESTDSENLDDLTVDVTTPPEDAEGGATVRGRFTTPAASSWPYSPAEQDPARPDPVPVHLVPYHRWARHGPSTMRVWLPRG
jgi:uncharacterized protein